MTNDIEDYMNNEDFPESDLIDSTESPHACPCGKYSALDCMGECGFNDLKPPSLASVDTEEITQTVEPLPRLHWTLCRSNPFVRSVCPEMLTKNGYQVVDRNSPRNCSTPVADRPKAIFIYDRSYVVATLERVYSRLQCDALEFVDLACDACGLPDDSAIRHAACDDVAIANISDDNTNKKACLILGTVQDELSTFLAMLPSPDSKGKYPARYDHGVKLAHKLSALLAGNNDTRIPLADDHFQVLKEKVKRL